MNPNNSGEVANNGGRQNNNSGGSVFPKVKEPVSTKVVKTIAKGVAKGGKSIVDAANNHKNKSKVNPDN
ncbi:hypothetical protein CDL12_26819 [Handroanthus impetiginosus]|uniref:Uncharacterized protein n=1 Tax=Handroanthus impetiginosus TaxID=429701 RepID=A0A2G9G5U3_9LAMI|nr:hypothetical protein CDL12_26819 [Handroanthus impetiginosus]